MEKAKTKKQAQDLQKKLSRKHVLVWDALDETKKAEAFSFCEGYKEFLSRAKTEREAVAFLAGKAEKAGFSPLSRKSEGALFARNYDNKCLALARMGNNPADKGFVLVASHVDAPRLDLKQNPAYEECGLAFLKTHYYGGIHKYQWLSRPLALHGRVLCQNGRKMDVVIGESPDDPVFTIMDILPHLAGEVYGGKTVARAFEAEKLNVLCGSLPLGPDGVKDRFKLTVLDELHRRFSMTEEDLLCAELEIVPAGPARDVGLDRSLVGAYGQDDRICSYCAAEAIFSALQTDNTCVCFFFDKEEIGSEGKTGAKSLIVSDFLSDLLEKSGAKTSERALRKAFLKSRGLSGDVISGLDPDYTAVHEKKNAARLGYGVSVSKYTGVRGKAGSNDANAEFLAQVRKVFAENGIVWQTGELGRVDAGGGGTIAKFLAELGMDIVDCGPPLLSMHGPMEIVSKPDVYMTHLAYRAFLKDG
ncbi:MAG: aminopeptidase [Thermodesulfobacteriota bacterium]